VNVDCENCKRKFYKKPSQIAKSRKNFCSIKCSTKSRKNGKTIRCFACNKEAYKQRKDIKKNQRGKFFCSRKCSTKYHNSIQVGANHPNWKFGEFVYRSRMENNQKEPHICKLCSMNNKSLLVAHHIDESRRNNNVSNLCWLCYNCHHLVHNYKSKKERLERVLKNDKS